MYVYFSGKEVAVYVEEESTFTSKHTGSELRRVRVGLVVQSPQAHEMLMTGIKKAEMEDICSTNGEGRITGRWKITESSFSTVGNELSPDYCHIIQLDEVEELKVYGLNLGGLVLRPYFYEEEFDCDDLSIKARVLASEEQDAELRRLMKQGGYIQVVRQGISEEPRMMRFSKTILWSKHTDGIKYELVLIDKSYDERDRPLARLFQPQMSRMQSLIAAQAEVIDEKLRAQVTRGILSEEDVSEIRSEAEEKVWDRSREFYQVDDIDEFMRPQPRINWD